MYELPDQVYNSVFALGEDYRKFFCLNKCEEHNVVYLLKEKSDEGTPLFLEDEAVEGEDVDTYHTMLPIWCHARYAEFYLDNSLASEKDKYEVVGVKLDLFKEQWAPALEANKVGLAILPLEQEKDFCVEDATVFNLTAEERQAKEKAQQAQDQAEAEAAADKAAAQRIHLKD